MSRQGTVSNGQLAVLFFSFVTGSSIINVPGPLIAYAQNGAWISLLASSMLGIALLSVILFLHQRNKEFTLIDYSRKATGNIATVLLLLPYIFYLLLMVTWIVMDVGAFMTSTMMRDTPSYVFHFLVLVTAAMTVRAGIEVMVRMFVLYTGLMIGFVFIVLLLSVGYYQPIHLLPVMPDGIKPVLMGTYFTLGFPYAEMTVFAMLLPYVRKQASSRLAKYMYAALGLNIMLLLVTTLCTLMLFGPLATDLKYPLFAISRVIDFADFLQRIESVVGVSLIASSYMKGTIALFVLNLVISRLFKLDNDRVLVYPIAMLSFMLSLAMFITQAEQTKYVSMYWPLINVSFALLPFLVIVVFSLFKSQQS